MIAVQTELAPEQVREAIDDADGNCLLVDVREPFEFAAEHIAGAISRPLSALDEESLRAEAGDRRIIFYCRTGRRSMDAMQRFADAERAAHLDGGLLAWRSAGLATVKHPRAPRLDIMRQVQVVAGALVLSGVLLGVFVSEWALVVSGFVGCGLMFAGLSGWCGMAKLLGAMPWNRLSP